MKNKVILLMLVTFLTSCQSSTNRFTQSEQSANTYSAAETGKLSNVAQCSIISIKPIKLSGSKAIGAGVGATVGAITASSAVGGKNDKMIAATLGALAGAVVGKTIEENTTAETGFEFLVKLDNGEIKTFAQKSKQGLRVGDKVYIIYGESTVRLTRQ